ncbi:MAG: alpha/beta fold hydrolase BchO [Pseudomonadota bacterium]
MSERLDWNRDGLDWPHRERSQFVEAGGLRWHVQHWPGPASAPASARDVPLVMLIHGTGSSTHSWRAVAPLLAEQCAVLAMDLPGHAFTGMPAGGPTSVQLSLAGMAEAMAALLTQLQMRPDWVVGHSAGAAVAVRMSLDGRLQPRGIIGLNAALLPLGGLAGQFFSPVARMMANMAFIPRYFSARAADPAVLDRLLNSTGSTLDADGKALYGRLVRNEGHAAGALGMMAQWDLDGLFGRLQFLQTPMDLIVGMQDHTVPPTQAERVLARLPTSVPHSLSRLEGLGHLAHEERPEQVSDWILARIAQG